MSLGKKTAPAGPSAHWPGETKTTAVGRIRRGSCLRARIPALVAAGVRQLDRQPSRLLRPSAGAQADCRELMNSQ